MPTHRMNAHEPLRRTPGSHRLRRVAAGAAVALVAATGVAQAADPAGIEVPAGNKLSLEAHATGVQIYDCAAAGSGYAWSAAIPRANLYGDNGKLIATHYAGPTWEARDGSKVVGKRDAGVTVDPTAIPWLRLSVVSATPGPEGGRFAGTTWIQRVNTVGGLTPAAGECTAASAGTRVEVPYSADYRFFKPTGA